MPCIDATYHYQEPHRRRDDLPDPHTRWLRYLELLSWQKGSLDDTGNRAFLRAGSLGICEQSALDEVVRRIQQAGERLRPAKRNAQLRSAYARSGRQANGTTRNFSAAPKWPATDWIVMEPIVQAGFGLFELWESSAIQFDDDQNHAEEIVDCLFPNAPPIDPLLCIGRTKFHFATRLREAWRGQLSEQTYIVPNPMLSIWGRNQQGELSQHSLEATAQRIYQVVEFDFEPAKQPKIAQWVTQGLSVADVCAALLWYLRKLMPLACVTSSAGKSLHGWFNVFGRSQADQLAFMQAAVALGADFHLWNRSQFSRLPDGIRENGQRQTCFLLNPQNCVSL